MEKIIKEYNVYDFNELDKNIQEDLLEQELQYMFEDYCEVFLKDDMEYEAERILEKYFGDKAELKNVYYSLSYCQGDGAMMEFDLTYYGKYVKIRHNGFYYHSRSFTIDDISTYGEYLTEKQEKQLYEKIVKANEELEKYGWSCVDTSNYSKDGSNREYAIERLEEHKYLKDGSRFNE